MVEFIKRQIGTDKQIAAWSLLISSILFLPTFLEILFTSHAHQSPMYYQLFAFLIASCLLLIGNLFILMMSYPPTFKLQMSLLTNEEKVKDAVNFYHIAAWFYLLASISFWVYPIIAYGDESETFSGLVLFGDTIIFLFACFFIYATWHTHYKENNKVGSRHLYSLFEVGPPFTDLEAAAWMVFLVTLATIGLSIYFVDIFPSTYVYYIFLFASVLFSLGWLGFALTCSYETYDSAKVYSLLCCQKHKVDHEAIQERSPLMSHRD